MSLGYRIFIYTSEVIVFAIGVFGAVRYKKLTTPLRYILLYVFIESAQNFVVAWMALQSIRTLWLSHCFSVFELCLFINVYRLWWNKEEKTILLWRFYGIYIVVWIVGVFTFEPITSMDIYSGALSQMIQIGFGSWLLLSLQQEDRMARKDDPRFWVLAGIVLYAAATFFMFGTFNEMLKLPIEIMRKIWIFNDLFVIIEHLFFLRAFVCKRETVSEAV
jgi:hypothetical protein